MKTTIETLPITDITFPKVTVCPPKNTYTDLNYHLKRLENTTVDDDTRNDIANSAKEFLYNDLHTMIMKNLSKIEDVNRYYNWYHGFTEIKLPKKAYPGSNINAYFVSTTATSGTISTQYFGKQFDAYEVETHIKYRVYIYPQEIVKDNENVTLHLQIQKISLINLASGVEHYKIRYDFDTLEDRLWNHRNYTPPGTGFGDYMRTISLERRVPHEEMNNMLLDLMPGFKLSWFYSGLDRAADAKYSNEFRTKSFARNGSRVFQFE